MQQQLSVITLGVAELARSRRFYVEGFGWTPIFENDEIVFYQMNGFVLGTWLADRLEADMGRPGLVRPGSFAAVLAVNLLDLADVLAQVNELLQLHAAHCRVRVKAGKDLRCQDLAGEPGGVGLPGGLGFGDLRTYVDLPRDSRGDQGTSPLAEQSDRALGIGHERIDLRSLPI